MNVLMLRPSSLKKNMYICRIVHAVDLRKKDAPDRRKYHFLSKSMKFKM